MTFDEAVREMETGRILRRQKYVTNATELNFWMGFDPRMPKEMQMMENSEGWRVILCAKPGDDPSVYVPTWDDYQANDWHRVLLTNA